MVGIVSVKNNNFQSSHFNVKLLQKLLTNKNSRNKIIITY